jgi:twitching motility protein PilT
MLEWINQNKKCHIITIEDPIEYVHESKMSIINQREVGSDTHSFLHALKHVLREDPDVILIGEMRDLETIESALNIAETGHLVFATLHTPDAVQSINRIVDVFPSHKQDQVRIQLSFVLLAVLTQQLLPRKEGTGRVLAYELMIANHAVRSMIREKKGHQLYSVIQTSQAEGMNTMNQCLANLYLNGEISYEQALLSSTDPEDLRKLIERGI